MPFDTPTPPPSAGETSYVNMTQVAERPQLDASLIGSHCEADYCNLLDFLPFLCQSCTKTFCLDHRTESAHKCAHAGAWAERKRQAQLAKPSYGAGRQMQSLVAEKDCASPSCKTRIGTSLVQGVHCDKCNRDYCLKHRFEDDHDCKNLEPIGARPAAAVVNKAFNTAFSNFKAWTKTNKEKAAKAAGRALPKAKPTSASQRIVAVNDLKKTAKGDDKLAAEKRVYLYVEAEAATTTAKLPKGKFFYSKDWVIGRVLDAAAKSLQIENVNNQSNKEEDKLRVFHVEGGRVLEYNEKVGAALTSGNTVVLLRGVGPSTPDLIEL